MKVGDIGYILVNNRTVEEVVIKSISGNIHTVQFTNTNKAIRLPKHRLFSTVEEAMSNVPASDIKYSQERFNRPPELH